MTDKGHSGRLHSPSDATIRFSENELGVLLHVLLAAQVMPEDQAIVARILLKVKAAQMTQKANVKP